MKKLIDNGYMRNTKKGYVDKKGSAVTYYRTRNKIYIEDKFANIAKKL